MSDFDSTDMVQQGPRFSDKTNDDLTELLSPHFERRRLPEREGLPSSYRMRADAHYVDQLSAREPEVSASMPASMPPPTLAPASVSTPATQSVPPGNHANPDLMASLTESVTTIHSAAAVLATESSPLARRVALDLVRAEAWRASWQLRAVSILDGGHVWNFRPLLLGSVLGRVRDGLVSECRLSGVDIKLNVMDWSASADVDEDAVICAVTGAIAASVGLAGTDGAPQVALAARRVDGRPLTVEITQDRMLTDSNAAGRFFDPDWSDRPGGRTAMLGAATAKAVAERHGGDAAFVAGDGRGSTVRLTFGRPKLS